MTVARIRSSFPSQVNGHMWSLFIRRQSSVPIWPRGSDKTINPSRERKRVLPKSSAPPLPSFSPPWRFEMSIMMAGIHSAVPMTPSARSSSFLGQGVGQEHRSHSPLLPTISSSPEKSLFPYTNAFCTSLSGS